MKTCIKNANVVLENKILNALNVCGYSINNVVVSESNRPDLGEYQYNGVMGLAKVYHKNPVIIANEIVDVLKNDLFF